MNRIYKALDKASLSPRIKHRLLLYGAQKNQQHTMPYGNASLRYGRGGLYPRDNFPPKKMKTPSLLPPGKPSRSPGRAWPKHPYSSGELLRGHHPRMDPDHERRGALRPHSPHLIALDSIQFHMWPLELAFHTQCGRPTRPSVVSRNVAILLTSDLRPVVNPEVWSGNEICTSFTSRLHVLTNEDDCCSGE